MYRISHEKRQFYSLISRSWVSEPLGYCSQFVSGMLKRLSHLCFCSCLLVECGCAFLFVTLVDIYLSRRSQITRPAPCWSFVYPRLCYCQVFLFRNDSEHRLAGGVFKKLALELSRKSCSSSLWLNREFLCRFLAPTGGKVAEVRWCSATMSTKAWKSPFVCEFEWLHGIKISICVMPHVTLAVSSEVGWDSWIRDLYKCQHAWLSVARVRDIHF